MDAYQYGQSLVGRGEGLGYAEGVVERWRACGDVYSRGISLSPSLPLSLSFLALACLIDDDKLTCDRASFDCNKTRPKRNFEINNAYTAEDYIYP